MRRHAVFLLGALLASELQAAPIRELVVFGDSHSDVGNGCTHFPDDPDCVGLRYTNGPVWVEELAERLAVPPPLASVAGGLNFAFGGARTGFGSGSYQGTPAKCGDAVMGRSLVRCANGRAIREPRPRASNVLQWPQLIDANPAEDLFKAA